MHLFKVNHIYPDKLLCISKFNHILDISDDDTNASTVAGLGQQQQTIEDKEKMIYGYEMMSSIPLSAKLGALGVFMLRDWVWIYFKF